MSTKRLDLGLRTNRDWFVRLARCREYIDDLISIARVRPRAEKRVGSDVVWGDGIIGRSVLSIDTTVIDSF